MSGHDPGWNAVPHSLENWVGAAASVLARVKHAVFWPVRKSSGSAPKDGLSDDKDIASVQCAFKDLPGNYRDLLILQVRMSYSIAEIARELALSAEDASRGLAAARHRLRDLCSEDTSLDPAIEPIPET